MLYLDLKSEFVHLPHLPLSLVCIPTRVWYAQLCWPIQPTHPRQQLGHPPPERVTSSPQSQMQTTDLFVPGDDAGDEDEEEEAADLLHVTVEGALPLKKHGDAVIFGVLVYL